MRDEQWQLIRPWLPPPSRVGRPPTVISVPESGDQDAGGLADDDPARSPAISQAGSAAETGGDRTQPATGAAGCDLK